MDRAAPGELAALSVALSTAAWLDGLDALPVPAPLVAPLAVPVFPVLVLPVFAAGVLDGELPVSDMPASAPPPASRAATMIPTVQCSALRLSLARWVCSPGGCCP